MTSAITHFGCELLSDISQFVTVGSIGEVRKNYSHRLIKFNISSENNDFGFNSIQTRGPEGPEALT